MALDESLPESLSHFFILRIEFDGSILSNGREVAGDTNLGSVLVKGFKVFFYWFHPVPFSVLQSRLVGILSDSQKFGSSTEHLRGLFG